MKLSKFLLCVTFITLVALLYVYQQTEIFRLAYIGQKQGAAFQVLLDKNTILRYNKERNTSLIKVGEEISKNVDFEMPDTYRLVRLISPQERLRSRYIPKKEDLLSRLFGIKRQAEARTIKP